MIVSFPLCTLAVSTYPCLYPRTIRIESTITDIPDVLYYNFNTFSTEGVKDGS